MSDETTTDRLAEIEGQQPEPEPQPDYIPPEGWRVLQPGEVLEGEDWLIDPRNGNRRPTLRLGRKVEHQIYIRRIEPEPEAEPENCGFEGKILREQPQPVQVREGRWRTRGGDIRNVTFTPAEDPRAITFPWHDARHDQTWLSNGRYNTGHGESPLDLWEYLGPIQPEPEKTITPDDVAAEALVGVWDQAQAEQQIAELRSEVSYVQGLLGESRKAVNSEARDKADLQHRLDVVAAEWAQQCDTIQGLQTQLEAVKAELVQVSRDRYTLQIELDAREQVPQVVSDRFEEGWDAGTAQAVETIAEWLEPLRKGNCTLRAAVLFHLPAIMRSLTGLTEED